MDIEPVSSSLSERALDRLSEAAALLLWQMGAIRVQPEEPFRLASGNFSPIYVNCRRAISEPAFMQLYCAAARLLLTQRGVELEVVAGGETAGIPYAAQLSQTLGCPMVYVRKKPKGYGIAARVEGHFAADSKVLLVEDLITDGGSKLGFLEAISEAGGQVRDALVLFDREQGGAALLAEHGVRLHAVAGRASAMAAARGAGLLSADAQASVDDYFANPVAWHEARGLEYREVGPLS